MTGPSGSGKSTLLAAIVGDLQPRAGRILRRAVPLGAVRERLAPPGRLGLRSARGWPRAPSPTTCGWADPTPPTPRSRTPCDGSGLGSGAGRPGAGPTTGRRGRRRAVRRAARPARPGAGGGLPATVGRARRAHRAPRRRHRGPGAPRAPRARPTRAGRWSWSPTGRRVVEAADHVIDVPAPPARRPPPCRSRPPPCRAPPRRRGHGPVAGARRRRRRPAGRPATEPGDRSRATGRRAGGRRRSRPGWACCPRPAGWRSPPPRAG